MGVFNSIQLFAFLPSSDELRSHKDAFPAASTKQAAVGSVSGVGAGPVPEDGPESPHCGQGCSVPALALADTDPLTRTLSLPAAEGLHAEHCRFFPSWLKASCLLAQMKLLKNTSFSLCLRVTSPQNVTLVSAPKAAVRAGQPRESLPPATVHVSLKWDSHTHVPHRDWSDFKAEMTVMLRSHFQTW